MKALIVWGGWNGHEPKQVGDIFHEVLEEENFEVEVENDLNAFLDIERLKSLELIVPIWTMGTISKEQCDAVTHAVADGVGIAGCHGGMCDAFRESTNWQFMTGGNWVSHPGGDGIEYEINFRQGSSEIVKGMQDFKVESEQYYLHVDPAVEVLATTRFQKVRWYHSSNGVVDMPVVWTKKWGAGRVFYNSLGHKASIFTQTGPKTLMKRGFLWAAEGKQAAREQGLNAESFENTAKMF